MAAVVYTHNLAIGVPLEVLLSGIFFAAKIAQVFGGTSTLNDNGRVRTYRVEGQLFHGSIEDFIAAFDFRKALDMAVMTFRRAGAVVEIIGMNAA